MLRRASSLVIFATLASGAFAGQRADAEASIQAAMAAEHIPGLAVAVVKNGQPILVQGYGFANLELGDSVRSDTVFEIGSLSKQFIASAIMLLARDRKLGLDDQLTTFFPGAPASWQGITIRHLLSHTAGLPRELKGWGSLRNYADADLEKLALQTEPETKPGEKYSYSNAGYFILALVIDNISGEPWLQFMHDRIFAPLQMDHTRPAAFADVVPGRSASYHWADGHWENVVPVLSIRPSGAFLSTAEDMVKWELALRSNSILTAQEYATMTSPTPLNSGQSSNYGFGWSNGSFGSHPMIWHDGSTQHFESAYCRFVRDDLTVIVLANCDSTKAMKLAEDVAADFF